MICASCHDTTAAEACSVCGDDALLDGRYRLEELLGSGASGMTFRATRIDDGESVAIKELDWRKLDGLKTEQLFNREAEVLRQLDHPGIPRHIETFTREAGRHVAAYLVQEYIDGQTLEEEQRDRRYELEDVLDIADELLEIVSYLHARTPPVIHRDIKPKNVMRRSAGDLVLIDFGSVRAVASPDGGSTVAGTVGYMAPEQLAGMAVPASDLFGVGALMAALLTRVDPATYLGVGKPDMWKHYVDVPRNVEELLTMLLKPDPDERADDARFVQQWVRDLRVQAESGTSAPARSDWTSDGPDERPPVVRAQPTPPDPTSRNTLVMVSAAIVTLLGAGIGVAMISQTTVAPPPTPPGPPPPPAISPELPGELGGYATLGDPLSTLKPRLETTDDGDYVLKPVIARHQWTCSLSFSGSESDPGLSKFLCASPIVSERGLKSTEKMKEFIVLKYGEPTQRTDKSLRWSTEVTDMALVLPDATSKPSEQRLYLAASLRGIDSPMPSEPPVSP